MKTIWAVYILAFLVCAAICPPAAGGDYAWNNNGGLWDVGANWTPSGPPGAGSKGTVNSTYTCIANANLAGGPTIQIDAGAILKCGNGGGFAFSGHTLVLNGGKWAANAGNKGVISSSDTIAMEADSVINATANGQDDVRWTIDGLIRDGLGGGKGKLTLDTSGLAVGNVGAYFTIASVSNTYSGGTVIMSDAANRGPLYVSGMGGLGLGNVLVISNGLLRIGATTIVAPGSNIKVNSNGTVRIGWGGISTSGHIFDLNGGRLAYGGRSKSTVTSADTVAVEANSVISLDDGGDNGQAFILNGLIRDGLSGGRGKLIYDTSGGSVWGYGAGPWIKIGYPTNTYSGGTLIVGDATKAAYVIATAPRCLGLGEVMLGANGLLSLDQATDTDWALTNGLSGMGPITVEGGSGNYRLIAAGSVVNPGTNEAVISTNMIGVLEVDGKFAFAMTNGVRSVLTIDVANAGVVAGVDHDQLKIDHGDAALGASIVNCDLVVHIGPTAMPPSLVLTNILASGADFSGQKFHSVTWLPQWSGRVEYGDGYVALKDINRGATIIIIR